MMKTKFLLIFGAVASILFLMFMMSHNNYEIKATLEKVNKEQNEMRLTLESMTKQHTNHNEMATTIDHKGPKEQTSTKQQYKGYETREIKALSEDRISGLLEGKGLQYALTAELNNYPGASHALEFSKELNLSEEQMEVLTKSKKEMAEETKIIGKKLVELEEKLDQLFANGQITEVELANITNEIAIEEGKLRNAHLKRHLEIKDIFTTEQVNLYNELRGYNDSSTSNNHTH